MLTRELYSPNAAVNKFTTPLPITNGGTGGSTEVTAVHNLGGIHTSDANIANGYAQLDETGQLPSGLFPLEAQGGPMLIGPSTVLIQSTNTWKISNYDSNESYTLTADQGFVSRNADTIYYTAPNIEGSYGFTINGKAVVVVISAHYVTTPSIISPANTTASLTTAILSNILFASDKTSGDNFGVSAALSYDGQRLAIGASGKTLNGLASAGQVYVYTKSNTDWVLETTITASDKAANAWFGISCSFTADGTRLAVGAPLMTVGGTSQAGQVYIYTRSGSTYTQEAIITASDKATNDQFGRSVSLDATATRIAIGATGKTVSSIANCGQVYTYTRSGSIWTQEATFTASDKVASDYFGANLVLFPDSSRIAIGCNLKDVSSLTDAGQTYIFVRNGSTWSQETTITASDKAAGDNFGQGITVTSDGTRLLIASQAKTVNTLINAGKVYSFVKNGTSWIEESYITASDNTFTDLFGSSLAVSGNGLYLVCGASNKDSDIVPNCGGVMSYDLTYTATSKILQPSVVNFTSSPFALTGQYLEGVLEASDKTASDLYARSLSFTADGSRLAIGAVNKTVGGTAGAGQVYVYTRSGSTFTLEATISPSDKAANDRFGISVSFTADGGMLAIGASGKTASSLAIAGQVYVYTRAGSTYTQDATITASDKAANDEFGYSVSITADGSRLAVGARNKTVSALAAAGQVYAYTRTGSTWIEEAKISASDKAANDYFGGSVSFTADGTRLAIGAFGKTVSTISGAGQVYTYTRSASVYTAETTISASDKATNDYFGISIAFIADGSRLAVGAYNKTLNGIIGAGQVYIYTRSGSIYTQESTTVATDKLANNNFGLALSFNSDASRLLIGAANFGTPDMVSYGRAYSYLMSYHEGTDWQLSSDPGFVNIIQSVTDSSSNKTTWQVTDLEAATDYYVRCRHKGTTYAYSDWCVTSKLTTRTLFLPSTEQTILTASDKAANDRFGASVCFTADGSRLAVGAPNKTASGLSGAGKVYVYTRSGNSYTQEAVISASDKAANDGFGQSVSWTADGSRLAVGANTKTISGLAAAGQVYTYTRSGSTYTQEATITASDKAVNDDFGSSVSFTADGSRLAIGAHGKDVSGVTDCGQVYVYSRSGSVYTQETIITASDKATSDWFGISLSWTSDGSRLAIGANGKTVSALASAGQAYVYTRSGSTYTLEATITASDKAANDEFGYSVSITADGSRLAVGARNKTVSALAAAGQVYIYARSGSVYMLEATITASDKAANDKFGTRIAFTANGGLLAIGAYNKTTGGVSGAGQVYVLS